MKTLALFFISCCLLAAPAFAAEGPAPVTELGQGQVDPDTIRVSYADLRLTDATDAAVLRERVRRATRRTCNRLYNTSVVTSRRWACVDIARRVAAPQIAAAIARAAAEQDLAGQAVVMRFAQQ